jgi:hypothetical protein
MASIPHLLSNDSIIYEKRTSASGEDKASTGTPDEFVEKLPSVLPAQVINIEENKGPLGYYPANDEERALDKRINRKLDFIVLPILSVNYALASLDKNSLGKPLSTFGRPARISWRLTTRFQHSGNALTVTFIKDTGFDPDVVANAVSMTAVASQSHFFPVLPSPDLCNGHAKSIMS